MEHPSPKRGRWSASTARGPACAPSSRPTLRSARSRCWPRGREAQEGHYLLASCRDEVLLAFAPIEPDRDDDDPSVEDEAMGRDIDVRNEELIGAGIRVFVGGLHSVKKREVATCATRW
jgi:hypothetical protein